MQLHSQDRDSMTILFLIIEITCPLADGKYENFKFIFPGQKYIVFVKLNNFVHKTEESQK